MTPYQNGMTTALLIVALFATGLAMWWHERAGRLAAEDRAELAYLGILAPAPIAPAVPAGAIGAEVTR